MRDSDISELKDALTALKKIEVGRSHFREVRRFKARASQFKRLAESPPKKGLSDFFADEEKAFRSGVRTRLKAHDRLATPVTPATPLYTRLESPFFIWAFRDGGPVNIFEETHIEPLNSWARFGIWWQHKDYIGPTDEVVFYFWWRNETGGDAVVNVESEFLSTEGAWRMPRAGLSQRLGSASSGPLERATCGFRHNSDSWNGGIRPPTQPLRQPNQSREVISLSARGEWLPSLGGQASVATRRLPATIGFSTTTFRPGRRGGGVRDVINHALRWEVRNLRRELP